MPPTRMVRGGPRCLVHESNSGVIVLCCCVCMAQVQQLRGLDHLGTDGECVRYDHSGTCVRRILLIVVIWEPFWHDFGTILGPSGDRWGDMVAYCQLGSVQKGSSIPS